MNNRIWTHRSFQSGTQIVQSNDLEYPHYYVYAGSDAEDQYRSQVCDELCNYLNLGNIPKWFSSLVRISDVDVFGENGIRIYATGPMVLPPNDNGALNWINDMSDMAKLRRKEIIDSLFIA